jgi:Zn-finger nucleic acid-binding protein
MNCPVCKDTTLVMTNRLGIELDYCPQCRGVWLDRGELDKIVEREAAASTPVSSRESHGYGRAPRDDDNYRDYEDEYRDDRRKRKKGGFFRELLDFD